MDFIVVELPVFVAARINGRGDQVLGMREWLGEVWQGKYAGVKNFLFPSHCRSLKKQALSCMSSGLLIVHWLR